MDTALAALIEHLSALSEDAVARPGPCRSMTEAARRNDVPALQEFLAGGADLHERTIGFASPLDAAAAAGHLEAVEFLLARGASLTAPGAIFPILYFPAINRRLEVIERLLQAGAAHEPQRMVLEQMGRNGSWDVVDAMIAGGMDRHWLPASAQAAFARWRTQEGPRNASWLAARREAETKRKVREAREVIGATRKLSDGAREAHENAAVALVAQHGETLAVARLPSGTSLLAQAATVRAHRLVAAFITAGAELTAADPANAPLTRAAETGDTELLAILLDAGAAPNGAAVIAAARAGSLRGFDLLIARGARLTAAERKAAGNAACGPDERLLRERLTHA